MMRKMFRKIIVFSKIIFLKILYKKRITFNGKIAFRKGFNVIISQNATLSIGKNVFFNNYCSINVLDNITIGDNCIFGENVKLYDHDHTFNKNEIIAKAGYKSANIIIGNNVWIGSNCVILKGVHIGDNSVIGAGTVLTENVDSNTVVYQNREIKTKKIERR